MKFMNAVKKFGAKLTAKALVAKSNAETALKNNNGDGHFVAVLVVVIIAVVLGVVFKDQLTGLLDTGMNKTQTMVNGLFS